MVTYVTSIYIVTTLAISKGPGLSFITAKQDMHCIIYLYLKYVM